MADSLNTADPAPPGDDRGRRKQRMMSRSPEHAEGSAKAQERSGHAPPRVVVKFRDSVMFPYEDCAERCLSKGQLEGWREIEGRFKGITLNRLFRHTEPGEIRRLMERAARYDPAYEPVNLLGYFSIDTRSRHEAEELADAVSRGLKEVELAYVESPPTPPPQVNPADDPLSQRQGYLNPAPEGIDARFAWTISGGAGDYIQFIDIEQGWVLNHEDLARANVNLLFGENYAYFGHGAAVMGIVLAQDNIVGGIGIAPRARGGAGSQWLLPPEQRVVEIDTGSSNRMAPVAEDPFYFKTRPPRNDLPGAIALAIQRLGYGDVLLIEAQSQGEYGILVPVEAERANFDWIRLGTACGIVIVEAAANGVSDLDRYAQTENVHSLAAPRNGPWDSGAIMVGGAKAARPHGREPQSNYGSRIDCYAWGEQVTTSGDGASDRGISTYTDVFGGTSSAAAIIAGAALSVQGMARAWGNYGLRLGPRLIRDILRDPGLGTQSADPPADRIGVMPNLRAIVNQARAMLGRPWP